MTADIHQTDNQTDRQSDRQTGAGRQEQGDRSRETVTSILHHNVESNH